MRPITVIMLILGATRLLPAGEPEVIDAIQKLLDAPAPAADWHKHAPNLKAYLERPAWRAPRPIKPPKDVPPDAAPLDALIKFWSSAENFKPRIYPTERVAARLLEAGSALSWLARGLCAYRCRSNRLQSC